MSHPTHDALLAAGLRLAEQRGLASISVNDIVTEANVAKGTFYVHFSDRSSYLVMLHQQFHDQLREAVLEATTGLPFGAERLRRGCIAYLDGCLRGKAVKALLLDARSEPAIAAQVQLRNMDFAMIARDDFAAIGWPNPLESACLYVVMGAEAALMELKLGHASNAVREALFHFIDRI